MAKVKNKTQLINNGKTETLRKARALVLDSYEAALSQVEPARLIKSKLSLQGTILCIEGLSFDLDKIRSVYVVGGGKASGEMASALEQILGNYITKGIVNVPKGSKPKTERIVLHEASHPIPNQAGVEGAMQMLKIAELAGEDDLLICLLSGGGSSLMPLPRKGLTLKDKQELTQTLLKSGANISEINTVRKHLSAFKGGNLAQKAFPATVLSLIISDVVGDRFGDIASGPTAPDESTFLDAQNVLKKFKILEDASLPVQNILLQGQQGIIAETPKPNDATFQKVYNIIIGSNQTVCITAQKFFEAQGIETHRSASSLEGEARQVASDLASRIRKAIASKKPTCLIAGGETTVKVTGKGVGGRNQELALASALELEGVEGFVFASLSTDGVDGPTDAAGAIIDSGTLKRAELSGLNPQEFLVENDSYTFFSKLDDLVFTGRTGTNVNDIVIALIL
jgi:glycerate-2-kinase